MKRYTSVIVKYKNDRNVIYYLSGLFGYYRPLFEKDMHCLEYDTEEIVKGQHKGVLPLTCEVNCKLW